MVKLGLSRVAYRGVGYVILDYTIYAYKFHGARKMSFKK